MTVFSGVSGAEVQIWEDGGVEEDQEEHLLSFVIRFLFVKSFIEVASLFTLRGRREGVS